MWPFRKHVEHRADPDLTDAEDLVADLSERAHHVERVLRPRHDRNHWSETVEILWKGGAAP